MAILLDICVVTDDKHGRQRTRELQSKKEKKKTKGWGIPLYFTMKTKMEKSGPCSVM